MQAQPPELVEALTASTQYPTSTCEVIEGGASPTDPALYTLYPTSGGISLDETRPVLRTASSLVVVDEKGDLTPGNVGDLLHPSTGHEIRVKSGRWVTAGGERVRQLNSAGVYRFGPPHIKDDKSALTIELNGLDRAFAFQQARWTKPLQVGLTDSTIIAAMRRIIADRWTGSRTLQLDSSACVGHPIMEMAVPNSVFGTDQTVPDPWADLQTLATAGGCQVYPDGDGVPILKPYVDAGSLPVVAQLVEGANCTVVDIDRDIDPTKTFSGIVVTGGSSQHDPVRVEVWDTDPNSPTYVGTVGYIPAYYDSPLIKDPDQALLVGEGLLHRLKLSAETLTLNAIPNPGLEGADAVNIRRLRAKVNGVFLMSNYTLDLNPTVLMPMTTRSTSVIPGVTIT